MNPKLSIGFLAALCVLGSYSFKRAPVNGAAKPPAPTPAALMQPQTTEPKAQVSVPVLSQEALHPLVKFNNPGNLQTFRDPHLADAYGVYFSLIGPARDQHPFSGSPFDTPQNSRLAYQTLKALQHRAGKTTPVEILKEAYLATTHLAHAQAPGSQALRESLIRNWVETIETGPSRRVKTMVELDLRALLTAMPEAEAEILPAIYRATSDPVLRDGIALATYTRLQDQGLAEVEIQTRLSQESISLPTTPLRALHKGEVL